MEKKKYLLGVTFVVIAAILWGIDGIILTPRLFNLPVTFVVLLLHLLPFLLMSLFFYKEFKHLKKFTKKDYIGFGLIGLFGGALGTLAIVKALFLVNFQSLTIVVLLQKLQPVFAITLARLILKEKLGKNFLPWAIGALVAGYFMTFGFVFPNFSGENYLHASFYAVLAAFSFGSATVFGKLVLNKWTFKTALFYRYGFTTLIAGIIVAAVGGADFSAVTKINWIILLIITFTTGAFAIALYYYGLKFITAQVATMCELAFPVSSAILDYFINKTILSPVQWIAAAGMLFMIYKVTKTQENTDIISNEELVISN